MSQLNSPQPRQREGRLDHPALWARRERIFSCFCRKIIGERRRKSKIWEQKQFKDLNPLREVIKAKVMDEQKIFNGSL